MCDLSAPLSHPSPLQMSTFTTSYPRALAYSPTESVTPAPSTSTRSSFLLLCRDFGRRHGSRASSAAGIAPADRDYCPYPNVLKSLKIDVHMMDDAVSMV